MHGIYFFLEHLPEHVSPKKMGDLASDDCAERFGDYLDDNNWWRELFVCNNVGNISFFDHKPEEDIKDIEKSKRWDWVQLLALRCVAADLRLFDCETDLHLFDCESIPRTQALETPDKIDSLSFKELEAAIKKEIPRNLARYYEDLCDTELSLDGKSPVKSESDVAVDGYQRWSLAVGFEAFARSTILPFTPPGWGLSPERYRAFDLTRGDPANTILAVDIHT